MLKVQVLMSESYDDSTRRFVKSYFDLELEHSLVSLSKWEAEFGKPFLSKSERTVDDTMGYIRAMTLTPNVPPEVYQRFSNENVVAINEYVNRQETATTFREVAGPNNNNETYTAEVIYFMMFSLAIPKECENWHLAKLLTLIRVFNEKNKPQKKKTRAEQQSDLADRNRLNEERRRRFEEAQKKAQQDNERSE